MLGVKGFTWKTNQPTNQLTNPKLMCQSNTEAILKVQGQVAWIQSS